MPEQLQHQVPEDAAREVAHRKQLAAREILRTRIDNDFTYHPPRPDQVERYTVIRNEARELAHRIVDLCPSSRELSSALTKLEEVVMHANAAIARNE